MRIDRLKGAIPMAGRGLLIRTTVACAAGVMTLSPLHSTAAQL